MADALSERQPLFERYGRQWQPAAAIPDAQSAEPTAVFSQHVPWQAMQTFLQSGDLTLAEQGTAVFGAVGLRLPSRAQLEVQPLWGSIGYTLPAALAYRRPIPIAGLS